MAHEREAQIIAALRGERETDEPAAVRGHEIDNLGGDFFGGDGEIAFILAVLVIHHDDDATERRISSTASGTEMKDMPLLYRASRR